MSRPSQWNLQSWRIRDSVFPSSISPINTLPLPTFRPLSTRHELPCKPSLDVVCTQCSSPLPTAGLINRTVEESPLLPLHRWLLQAGIVCSDLTQRTVLSAGRETPCAKKTSTHRDATYPEHLERCDRSDSCRLLENHPVTIAHDVRNCNGPQSQPSLPWSCKLHGCRASSRLRTHNSHKLIGLTCRDPNGPDIPTELAIICASIAEEWKRESSSNRSSI